MKTPTPEQIARRFRVPVQNVKKQFEKNATQLRGMAKRAGCGVYRGKTSVEWSRLAQVAEDKSK